MKDYLLKYMKKLRYGVRTVWSLITNLKECDSEGVRDLPTVVIQIMEGFYQHQWRWISMSYILASCVLFRG